MPLAVDAADRFALAVARRAVTVALPLAGTGLTLLVLQAVAAAGGVSYRSIMVPGFATLWAAAMVATVAAGYLLQRLRGATVWVGGMAGVAAGLVCFPLLAGLHGTPEPLAGVFVGDQTFRTEYVTRMALGGLHDYTFSGLPAFYPPGWFWVAGRVADAAGVPAWQVIKPVSMLTPVVAVLLAYALWRCTLRPPAALAASVVSALTLGVTGVVWYEPYSAFVALAGVAWVAAVAGYLRGGATAWRVSGLVASGVVLALCYYLLFLIFVVAVTAPAVWHRGDRRRALGRLAVVVGGVAMLTAMFWMPFLLDLARGSATQGRFFDPGLLSVTTGFTDGTAMVVVSVLGLALLAFTIQAVTSQALAALLLAGLSYQLISVATLTTAHQQLQPQRVAMLILAALGAAVPVGLEALTRTPGSGSVESPARQFPALRHGPATTLAAALMLPALLTIGAQQGDRMISGPLTARAHHDTNLRPTLQAANDISSFITSTTRRHPQQLTVLSTWHPLMELKPYYGFLQWNIAYANPGARTGQRVALLQRAAACPGAACFARTLEDSRFGPVDALVLPRARGGVYRFTVSLYGFPTGSIETVALPARLLDGPAWVHRDIHAASVYVLRAPET